MFDGQSHEFEKKGTVMNSWKVERTQDNLDNGDDAIKVLSEEGEIRMVGGTVICGSCGAKIGFNIRTIAFGSNPIDCTECPALVCIGMNPEGSTVKLWSRLQIAPDGMGRPKQMEIEIVSVEIS